MAVAGDRASRFGNGDAEVRVNKPLTMKPTFPRFLAVGDKALFGAVVTSQLAAAGDATVTIRSLDPDLLVLDGAVGAHAADRRRRIGRSPVRGRGQGDRTGADPDDGQARERDRLVRGRRFRWRCWPRPRPSPRTGSSSGATARGDESLTIPQGVVPGLRRPSSGDVLDGDGRPERGRPLSGRVSVRLRGAERIASAGDGAGGRSRRRFLAAGRGHREDAPRRAAVAEGARAVPVPQRRLHLLARADASGRLPT